MSARPPLVSRALAVRGALRAAPVAGLFLVLALRGAGRRELAVCASLAASVGATAFAERLAVVRARGRPGSWRCAVEASLACAALHAAAIVNAVSWLYAPMVDPTERLEAALAGHSERALIAALLVGWMLASPSGLLARHELGRWPRPRGTWVDDGSMLRWFSAWSVPPGLALVAVCVAGEARLLRGLGTGAAWAFVTWFFLFVLGTLGTVFTAFVDDLARAMSSEAPPEG